MFGSVLVYQPCGTKHATAGQHVEQLIGEVLTPDKLLKARKVNDNTEQEDGNEIQREQRKRKKAEQEEMTAAKLVEETDVVVYSSKQGTWESHCVHYALGSKNKAQRKNPESKVPKNDVKGK